MQGGNIVVEDVVRGLNDWRNIQEVVRLAFKSLHDLVKAQGATISKLESQLALRASKDELEDALQKVNEQFLKIGQDVGNVSRELLHDRKIVGEIKDNLGSNINPRLNITDSLQQCLRQVHLLSEDMERKADKNSLQIYASIDSLKEKASISELARKADISTVNESISTLASKDFVMKGMDSKASLKQVDELLSKKVDNETFITAIKGRAKKSEIIDAMEDKLKHLQMQLDEVAKVRDDFVSSSTISELVTLLDRKADAGDVYRQLTLKLDTAEFLSAINDKVNSAQLDAALGATTEAVAKEVKSALLNTQQEIVQVLNKKAYKVDVRRSLEDFMKKDEIMKELSKKASVTDVKEALSTKANTIEVKKVLDTKADNHGVKDMGRLEQKIKDLALYIDSIDLDGWKKAIDNVRNEMTRKADIDNLDTYLDSKSNIDDVNRALAEIQVAINERASKQDVKLLQDESIDIKHRVSTEMSLGRWIWKTGRVIGTANAIGGLVPWNVQTINTNSLNFIWDTDCDGIVCVSPGLYEVTAGFFTDAVPRIRLLVNGESVLTAAASSNKAKVGGVGTSSLRKSRHSAGTVTGWTLIDFLALPSRARIAVLYDGDDSTQGFLGLRKL